MAVNTIKATIQIRHGAESDLEPDKLVTGEWAVATDTQKIWMCFRPGLVLRMATYEGFEQDMLEVQTILAACQNIQMAVEKFMQLAEQHKNDARDSALLSESWAHGDTGVREEENTDNSKYWSEESRNHSNMSKSWAIGEGGARPDEEINSAKYFAEQAGRVVEAAGTGGLLPMGTVTFENLPASGIKRGWMYNISNDFVSDSRFEDGGNVKYKAGVNVYYTVEGKWDVLAGKQVTASDIGALSVSGGNASGNIGVRSVRANGAFFTARNTDSERQIDFGVSSNGTTRGIYDEGKSKWVVKITDNDSFFDGAAVNMKPIVLSNQNLDDLRPNNAVFYYAQGGNTVQNNPFGNGIGFGMYVYHSGGTYLIQEAASYNGKKIRCWTRGGGWTPWKTFAFDDAFYAATASAAGKSGLVPAPAAGKQNAYLRGDGTWVAPGTTLAGTISGIPLDQTMGKQLKDEIDEINGNLFWKQISECTGGQSIDISQFKKAREFLCLFAFGSYRTTINIPNFYLDPTAGAYYYGGASNGSDNIYAVCKFTDASATFVAFSKAGQDLSRGAMIVYYR